MYFGETPLLMKESRVGVRPRVRKSARKPSKEIKSVVGAKLDVLLLRRGAFSFLSNVVAR